MTRLLGDRYVMYDQTHACDLATGDEVRIDAIGQSEEPCGEEDLAALTELLEHGRDGTPRWVVAEAHDGAEVEEMTRRAASAARRRGFVTIAVRLYEGVRELIERELSDRALFLIGGFVQDGDSGRHALVNAATVSPRPHVLLTFRGTTGQAAVTVAREVHAVYGGTASPLSSRLPDSRDVMPGRQRPPRKAPWPADVARHIDRARRAESFIRAGRHAAAERLLRDVGAALGRRRAYVPAADVALTLGRLLVERGRASAAEAAFVESARLALEGEAEDTAAFARVWQAWARTEQGRLTEAESMLRAVVLTAAASGARAWATAALARCLLWQGREEDAATLRLDTPSTPGLDSVLTATIDDTAVRVLIAVGRVFEAGQRARFGLARASACDDPLAHTIAHVAYLRVACAAGDLVLASAALKDALGLARAARAPFRGARARLVWLHAVQRAGLPAADVREACAALHRFLRVAPPLLRAAIERALHGGSAAEPSHLRSSRSRADVGTPLDGHPRFGGSVTAHAATLLRLAHEEEDDRAAVLCVLERVARDLNSSRTDLLSADAGPVSVILTAGLGLPTTLGARVLETGMVIGPDEGRERREAGVPIRLGARLLGAMVCRWPVDRSAPVHAMELLDVTAAVLAPRIDAMVSRARETARASTSIPELVGVSAMMTEVRKSIARAASAPFAVLIEGESGVGKELVARALHQLGPRRERRFCDVNCAALPDELLESELFGHSRGAFTGAVTDRAGLFEEADGGTLFLDEVSDLSARAQAKLLRVVQQQEVRRVGESFSRSVDVRLVAAANRDMRSEAAAGRFRQDLLYRLDVIRLRLPPLRERPEDITVLAEHFWGQAATRVGSTATLTPQVLADLSRYHWPGNVRELQNVIAALAVAAPSRGRVRPSLLPPVVGSATVVASGRLGEARDQFERRFVEAALARASGSRSRAAASLGVSRQGLLKMMARLRIESSTGSGAAS